MTKEGLIGLAEVVEGMKHFKDDSPMAVVRNALEDISEGDLEIEFILGEVEHEKIITHCMWILGIAKGGGVYLHRFPSRAEDEIDYSEEQILTAKLLAEPCSGLADRIKVDELAEDGLRTIAVAIFGETENEDSVIKLCFPLELGYDNSLAFIKDALRARQKNHKGSLN